MKPLKNRSIPILLKTSIYAPAPSTGRAERQHHLSSHEHTGLQLLFSNYHSLLDRKLCSSEKWLTARLQRGKVKVRLRHFSPEIKELFNDWWGGVKTTQEPARRGSTCQFWII